MKQMKKINAEALSKIELKKIQGGYSNPGGKCFGVSPQNSHFCEGTCSGPSGYGVCILSCGGWSPGNGYC
ncbi:hypothetical protein EDB95_2021 [Dinghuibacter silviterrae]|uniref:Uncharacterized protein n=1 Tax=Dinghuibacter silviterrae TaxID=1539049 RepID=A0A4R8DRY8_9BACT|nr:hypothetical protein EDB95_2021 [Dinghuibacter silviterrae]